MDQNTGSGRALTEGEESLIGKGNERLRNTLIEGRRGRARLRENNKAAEKAKAERKSRMKEWLG